MQTIAANCNVYAADNIVDDLNALLEKYPPKAVFMMADEGSMAHCAAALAQVEKISRERTIVIPQGDDNKNVTSAMRIWEFLSSHGATRKSLLINLGGGMPCDLGGFCASTFKRGIDFINIPTTLLAQVDASLGGKTGMNLGGLKNEIGVFSIANAVIVDGSFLKTLDKDNLLSGFAEMLKHALIFNASALEELINFDFEHLNYTELRLLVCDSIRMKNHFVTADPTEKGIRKALNFGHTFGHAFETFAMRHNHPILHGFAVAYGMVCELIFSGMKLGLNSADIQRIANFIISKYGKFDFGESNFPELVELMTHDKKNNAAGINFTLLPQLGTIQINQIGTPTEIAKVLSNFLKY